MKPQVDSRLFGELANGEPVMEFTLDNGQGMLLSVLDYGCIIRSWRALGRHGAPVDFVLGFDTLLDYERDTARFGALVGRRGLHKRCWQGRASSDNEVARLTLWRLSRGSPRCTCRYTLSWTPFARPRTKRRKDFTGGRNSRTAPAYFMRHWEARRSQTFERRRR